MHRITWIMGLFLVSFICCAEGVPSDDLYIENNRLQNAAQPQLGHDSGKLIAYLPGWKTPPAAQEIRAAGYTHVIVTYGVFSTITPGQIMPAFTAVTPAYVQSLQAEGVKVLVSLGGPSTNLVNATTDFHQILAKVSNSLCFIEEFVNSLDDLLRQYHFNGFDFSIEHGFAGEGSFSNPTGDIAVLVKIMRSLHNKHPEILLSIAPKMDAISPSKTFDDVHGNYASLVMQTAPILSWVGIQLYDSGCATGLNGVCYGLNHPNNPDTYVAMASNLLEDWPSGYQPYIAYLNPSQLVLGFAVVNHQGISDRAPAAAMTTVKRTIQCLRTGTQGNKSCQTYLPPKAYPNLGGVFAWDLAFDQDNQYLFATSMQKCVMLRRCG